MEQFLDMGYNIDTLLTKASSLQELSFDQALYLYKNAPLVSLMKVADTIRFKLHPERKVSWQIDRNVNYTNICICGCKFCTFSCRPSEKEKGFLLSIEDYREKIRELISMGGEQLLLQGGLHPKLDIHYFEELFQELKKIEPSLKLNALGPPEVAHIARISKISIQETLERLVEAGLDTLPGAGAEILSDRVRRELSPFKPSVAEWIEVMRIAHQLGLSTTATMVYGSIESAAEMLEHLFILRELQKEKPEGAPGFRAFIPWAMQGMENRSENKSYLRIVAISRIVLLNIPHIQASWLTMGISIAQIALHSGADDMGSIMIEENVVSSTRLRVKARNDILEARNESVMDAEGIQRVIIESGFQPWLRDQQYRPL